MCACIRAYTHTNYLKTCVCFFVLLNRNWGLVTVPGFPRVNRPQIMSVDVKNNFLSFFFSFLTGEYPT